MKLIILLIIILSCATCTIQLKKSFTIKIEKSCQEEEEEEEADDTVRTKLSQEGG